MLIHCRVGWDFLVHQMHGVPRFPYLWCNGARGGHGASGPEHCLAFRQALDLRYHFIPYRLRHIIILIGTLD